MPISRTPDRSHNIDSMPRQKKTTPPRAELPPPEEIPIEPTTEAASTQGTSPPKSEPTKPNVKKYIVRCRYHIEESVVYRIYAATKGDAEEIARLRFRDERQRVRTPDAISVTEVVSD